MIVQIDPSHDPATVRAQLQGMGQTTTVLRGAEGAPVQLLIHAVSQRLDLDELRAVPGVAGVWAPASEHPCLDRQGPVVNVGDVAVGGGEQGPVLMAGPCSVESEAQVHAAAKMAANAGALFLRGGAFKPRTSPYGFQGHGAPALRWMRDAADAHGLKVVTEAMAPEQLDAVVEVADLLQIGARNMQNYPLLRAIGQAGKPALLKRGLASTLNEWRLAAEHLLHAGCPGVIFCERGVRGFDRETRFTLDLAAVALMRDVYHAPVIVDPSHAAGRRDLIPRLSLAAMAAGACGLIVEAHPNAAQALSDGPQQLGAGELLALGASLGLTRGVAARRYACA